MASSALERAHHPFRDIEHTVRTSLRWIAWAACVLAPPVTRLALAIPFLRSGLTKWSGPFTLSPTADFLFESMFKLHLFGNTYDYPFPDVLAHIDAIAEIALPVLLIVGLATRFSALGLLIMTLVIELTVPSAWATFHLPWAGLALAIMALGPGRASLDYALDTWLERRSATQPP